MPWVSSPRRLSRWPITSRTLSGTASRARRYADAVAGLPVKVLYTRKTLPGLRQAQKYAVRTGGCHNHRIGLYDAILIKENHIAAAGSVEAAVRQARETNPGMPVEIEVENEAEVIAALDARGVQRETLTLHVGAGTFLPVKVDVAEVVAAIDLLQRHWGEVESRWLQGQARKHLVLHSAP